MEHRPVLLTEVVDLLEPGRGGVFVDCTVGLGGHAEALLRAGTGVHLVGIDRDQDALAIAARRLRPFGDRLQLVAGQFAFLSEVLRTCGIDSVAGILADLGVSSLQLDTAARGFSFRREGPLDMRMGPGELTAADVVNDYEEAELERIFREYGEEKRARRIARAVVARRERAPLRTTTDLRDLIVSTLPRRSGPPRSRIDPATRVFQAVRIEVNRELVHLERLLDQATRLLEQDGRLVVISYHSLEDRIVKNRLRDLARGEVDEVTGRPRSETKVIEVLTRKPIRPGEDEIAVNPRARSARLRAARRI